MSLWKKICAWFKERSTVFPDYGPCRHPMNTGCTGRIRQKGEFRCYACWNADNYDAGYE